MGASEEAYGEGHPATFDKFVDENGNEVPRRPKDLGKAAGHYGQLSEQSDKFNPDVELFFPAPPEDPDARDHGPDN